MLDFGLFGFAPVVAKNPHFFLYFVLQGKTGIMTGIDGDDGMMDVFEFGEHDYLIVQISEVVKIADW